MNTQNVTGKVVSDSRFLYRSLFLVIPFWIFGFIIIAAIWLIAAILSGEASGDVVDTETRGRLGARYKTYVQLDPKNPQTKSFNSSRRFAHGQQIPIVLNANGSIGLNRGMALAVPTAGQLRREQAYQQNMQIARANSMRANGMPQDLEHGFLCYSCNGHIYDDETFCVNCGQPQQ